MEQGLSPAFWRLWRAAAAGNLADGVLRAALPLLVVQYTTSPVAVAGVTTAMSLPWLAVLLVGVWVDRGDRRALLSGSGVVRGVALGVAAVLLWLAPPAGVAVVLMYVAAVTMGTAETFAETSAGALIPTVATDELLPRANGRLHGVSLVANQFVGPPLAGVLAAVGAATALGVPAVGYMVAGLVAWGLPTDRSTAASAPGWVAALREGVAFVARHPTLRRLVVVTGLWNLASGMTFSVLVLFAVAPGPMGLSEPQYGMLLASAGVGGLVASLLTEQVLARVSSQAMVGIALAMGATALAAPAVTTQTAPIAVGLAVNGAAAVSTGITIVSLRQRLTPNQMLGRVNAAFWTASAGMFPLGSLAGGLIAETMGLRTTFALAGLVAAMGLGAVATLTDAKAPTNGSHL